MSLTTGQHAAITTYAQRHGRTWKADLRHAWMTGYYPDPNDDSASLQQIRNAYGPAWLVRFRVPLPVIREQRQPSPASPQWETATPGCTGPDY